MFQSLIAWALPRVTIVRFWAIGSEENPRARLGEPLLVWARNDPGVGAVELIDGGDPESIVRVADAAGLTATEAATRVSRGSRCASLSLGTDPATVCWVSDRSEWIGEIDRWFEPPPGQAYVWSCVTRGCYRGRHFYSTLLRQIVEDLLADGYRRIWIAAEIGNEMSARGIRRAGFCPIGIVSAFRGMGIQRLRLFADPVAPASAVEDLRHGLGIIGPRSRTADRIAYSGAHNPRPCWHPTAGRGDS